MLLTWTTRGARSTGSPRRALCVGALAVLLDGRERRRYLLGARPLCFESGAQPGRNRRTARLGEGLHERGVERHASRLAPLGVERVRLDAERDGRLVRLVVRRQVGTSFVASPTATTSTPVAIGLSVPA